MQDIRPSPHSGEVVEVTLDPGEADVRTRLGQVIGLTVEDKVCVATFDDDLLEVAEQLVQKVRVPLGKDGGFDVAFPADLSMIDSFASQVMNMLEVQSFCVVQMRSTPAARAAARLAVEAVDGWENIAPEFQRDYLGKQLQDKAKWFKPGEPVYADLSAFDNDLDELSSMLSNYDLGFTPSSRSNTLLRVVAADAQDMEGIIEASQANDILDAVVVEQQLAFLARRRLAFMSFVSGEEGLVELQRWTDRDIIKVPVKENRILIFRHDVFDYCRRSNPGDVVLQAWILREELPGEVSLASRPVEETQAVDYEIPQPPEYGRTGEKVEVVSCHALNPCGILSAAESWCVYVGAGDGVTSIPLLRWDHQVYYSEEQGGCYANHCSFIDTHEMSSFDADAFGYTLEEAAMLDPLHRKGLEVGYECLFRGGWNKATLNGAQMTVALGVCNGDTHRERLIGTFAGEICKKRLTIGSSFATSARMGYIFGIKGPVYGVDTACSSSLTAVGVSHSTMRPEEPGRPSSSVATDRMKAALVIGMNGVMSPGPVVAFASASMLSHRGRCFTFDQSADGYLRAEGQSALHLKVSSDPEGDPLRLSMLCGTSANQDGKSANLTAPNGPSQQEAIRQSLREAQISSLKVQIQELHGTGTALGDPIEVGALRAVMIECKVDGQWRKRAHPLVKTSSKSNLGHMEMNAGMCGLLKCVYMSCHACAVANVHLRWLNSHTDTEGYPVLFTSEIVDQGEPAGYFGVSSFGFSGCNARADIWGRALAGVRSESNHPLDVSNRRCRNMKREQALTMGWGDQLLQGAYLTGNPMRQISTLMVGGSFNGRTDFEEMYVVPDPDADVQGGPEEKWSFLIRLGETRVEYFRLFAPELGEIFPQEADALENARILGPGAAPGQCQWRIDARGSPAVAVGSFYRILFWYDEEDMAKRISWDLATPAEVQEAEELRGSPFTVHKAEYFIVGTFTSEAPSRMQLVHGKPRTEESVAFEYTIHVGLSGLEEFQIWRDRDKSQAIYPSLNAPPYVDFAQSLSGPDSRGLGKRWSIRGQTGEKVTITIEVIDGDIRLCLASEFGDIQSFHSQRSEVK